MPLVTTDASVVAGRVRVRDTATTAVCVSVRRIIRGAEARAVLRSGP